MKRIISKRFLSLALAIIMVAALIPGSAFAVEGDKLTFDYAVDLSSYEDKAAKVTYYNGLKTRVQFWPSTVTSKDDATHYLDSTGVSSDQDCFKRDWGTTSTLHFTYNRKTYWFYNMRRKAGTYWPEDKRATVFNVKVGEEPKIYKIKQLSQIQAAYSGDIAIYVNGQYAGAEYTEYKGTGADKKEITTQLNTLKLTPDEYGFVEIAFRPMKCYYNAEAGNPYGTARIYPIETVFEEVASLSIVDIEYTAPSAELAVGTTTDPITAKVKMSDGNYRFFHTHNGARALDEANGVFVTSSHPDVVSVSERTIKDTDTTFSLTALKPGTATITVTAKVEGTTEPKVESFIVNVPGAEELPETVTAGVLTNYKDAVSGVTASGYDVNSTKQVAVGTKITAEAKDTTDYKFICWKVGGAFLQTDAKVENYVVNTNTSLTAVYEPINTELKIVEFWNANKQFLSMDDDSEDGITIPEAPAVTGFKLTGNWLVDEGKYLDVASLEAGTTRAVAEVEDTKNAITGEVKYDGEKVSEEHIYGTEVTRAVSDAKYWTRDGKPVFFGETYTYFMWDGTEIEAHTEEKTAEPVIILDDYANDAYMIEYCVPAGFTKVEAGILFGMAGSKPTVSEFSSKAASQSSEAHGQFTAQADDDEVVVRGYLIYKDGADYKVIYAD